MLEGQESPCLIMSPIDNMIRLLHALQVDMIVVKIMIVKIVMVIFMMIR